MTTRKDAYVYRSKLPFVKNDGARGIIWWNVTPTGKWVEDFTVGREYARKFWDVCGSGRAFALEFQQIILGMLTAAKSHKGPKYAGIEAGFLLAVGELSGAVNHIQAQLQNHDARVRRTRVVDGPLNWDEIVVGRYTPDHWEFGVAEEHELLDHQSGQQHPQAGHQQER